METLHRLRWHSRLCLPDVLQHKTYQLSYAQSCRICWVYLFSHFCMYSDTLPAMRLVMGLARRFKERYKCVVSIFDIFAKMSKLWIPNREKVVVHKSTKRSTHHLHGRHPCQGTAQRIGIFGIIPRNKTTKYSVVSLSPLSGHGNVSDWATWPWRRDEYSL